VASRANRRVLLGYALVCAAALLCSHAAPVGAAEDQSPTPAAAPTFPVASGARLAGDSKQTRFVRLPSAEILEQPAVQTLLQVAAERAQTMLPATGRGKLVIRSVSAKQRPRRKPGKT